MSSETAPIVLFPVRVAVFVADVVVISTGSITAAYG